MEERYWYGRTVAAFCIALTSSSVAQEPQPLPEPLTLEYALSLAEAAHPEVRSARAELALAAADIEAADAGDGVVVSMAGRLRWVQPPDVVSDHSEADHAIGLFLRKNLYDFGRTRALQAAARSDLAGRQWAYQDLIQQRRIAIMERFFQVLLADTEMALQDEALAVVYVALDKLRVRSELGQVSDIELLELEHKYQQTRRARAAAEARQRATRAELARLLDRPGMLPSSLAPPELPQLDRNLPEYEELAEQVVEQNPALKAVRAELEAADERISAARARYGPLLTAEAETAAYTRELSSYDKWRAGINFEVPLYTAGATDAAVARAQAEKQKLQARLESRTRDLRQTVLELWLELNTLRVQRDEMLSLRDYRELYLDRSRAIYELEVKTDLGDAMVRLTEAQLAAARTRYQIALNWERLDALQGRGGNFREEEQR